ncbi:MAG: hypothetical protein LAT53_06320 [Idiomarina sp.]|nr:hypothetical protein [Idiomarina sp.]
MFFVRSSALVSTASQGLFSVIIHIGAHLRSVLAPVAVLMLAVVLSGCNEEHPDNKPGAVNNPYPTVSLGGVGEVQQPALGASRMYTLQLELSRAAPAVGSVRLRSVNGTALGGEHFAPLDRVVNFAEGERLVSTAIEILDGGAAANGGSFTVSVVSGVNLDINGSSALNHQITITPRPQQPDTGVEPEPVVANLQLPSELSLRAPRASRGSVEYPIVFTLDAPTASAGSVTLQSVDGSAEADTHFTTLNETIAVPAGAQEVAFAITLLHDANQSSNLEFSILAVRSENISLPSERSVPVTVVNSNDELATPSLALPSLTELYAPPAGSRDYQLLMALSAPASQAGSVQVRSQELTAQAGVHFQSVDNEITFAAGATEILLPVTVNHVNNETEVVAFAVQLSAPVNVQLPSTQQFNITIQPSANTEVVPELQLPAVINVPEPREAVGAVEYEFWLALSQPASKDGSVVVRTFAGSALAGINYTAIENQRIEFAAGDDIVRVPLEVLYEGGLLEAKELQLQFSHAENVLLPASRSFAVAIGGADSELPSVSIDTELEVVRPPEGVNSTITVVLPLTPAAILPGELRLVVNQGSALFGRDITAIPSAVTFARGDREVAITFTLVGSFATADRTFSLVFTEASNAILPISFSERQINVTIVAPE